MTTEKAKIRQGFTDNTKKRLEISHLFFPKVSCLKQKEYNAANLN